MEEPEFLIPIDEAKEEFKQHFELPYNKRILFSAPFGTGKTYFLDKFFGERKESDKVLHLFPVNYSVSSNEDVFELIKFDILFQLLEDEELILDKLDFTTFFTSQFFLLNNAEKFAEWILKRFGKTGKSLVGYAKAIEKLVTEYKKFEADMNTNAEEDAALNFLLDIRGKKGSAYEEDAITQLIQSFLQQLSGEEKQSVIVIDDLDRIDPEHIFRLLNVFAAHFDIGEENTNKFGFDKVIFVCDINNIRNIFYAKYGSDTDFSGYIDKFYSATNFFYFNNKWATRSKIEETVLSADFDDIYNTSLGVQSRDNYNWTMLIEILNILCIENVFNLRTIEKINNIPIHAFRKKSKQEDYSINYTAFNLFLIFDIVTYLTGDYQKVQEAFGKRAKNSSSNVQIPPTTKTFFVPRYETYFSNIIIVLANDKGFLSPNMSSFFDEVTNVEFNFFRVNLTSQPYKLYSITADSDEIKKGKNLKLNLYEYLLRALDVYKSL